MTDDALPVCGGFVDLLLTVDCRTDVEDDDTLLVELTDGGGACCHE